MEDNDKEKEFLNKIKIMSLDELVQYDRSARIASFFLSGMGIASIVLALFITNLLTVVLSLAVVILFSNICVGLDDMRKEIKDRILVLVKSR